jgi:hypothetical protein
MSLSELFRTVPPPQNPIETGTGKTWEKIQQSLGLHLPEDYKAFINCYGSGIFNNFLIPYNPHAKNETFNLTHALDTHHRSSRKTTKASTQSWSIVSPFELYPGVKGLLPWGTSTHFEMGFFWQVDGPPETWITIFYNLRVGEYEVWKMQFTSFLVKLFNREIVSTLLPLNFPPLNQPIEFHSIKNPMDEIGLDQI